MEKNPARKLMATCPETCAGYKIAFADASKIVVIILAKSYLQRNKLIELINFLAKSRNCFAEHDRDGETWGNQFARARMRMSFCARPSLDNENMNHFDGSKWCHCAPFR
jgi:hypothetical protein